MPILEMFSYPFVQRAFVAGLMLAVLLASLGIFVTLRKMAFFGDGIAHSSLAGIAIALLLGLAPLPVALIWAIVVALAIYAVERSTRLPSDTLIGIFFTASMALGVVLMSFTKGYQPELVTYLFGSILGVRQADLVLIVAAAAPTLAWLIASFRELTYMSLAEENARVAGVPVAFHTLALYVALSVATVLGVKVLGIVLVSALLVLPAATSRMLTTTFRGYLVGSVVLAVLTTATGLAASFLYDLPSGATIILTGALVFFLAGASKKLASAGRRA
jgi:zinc transport system permease protein